MTFRGTRREGNSPETCSRSDTFCQDKYGMDEAAGNGQGNSLRIPMAMSSLSASKVITLLAMSAPPQTNVKLTNAPDYREAYANSVQMRVNVWDFFLVFGTVQQQSESQVEIRNFQGIYLSPQQAKALLGLLQQNVNGYETAFGEIKLDPRMSTGGQVH
jgi:flagellar protein FlaG